MMLMLMMMMMMMMMVMMVMIGGPVEHSPLSTSVAAPAPASTVGAALCSAQSRVSPLCRRRHW
jgi:hypothetical protein